MLRTVAETAARVAAEFSAQSLANMAWACAKLGIDNPPLMHALAWQAAEMTADLRPQHLGVFIDLDLCLGDLNDHYQNILL